MIKEESRPLLKGAASQGNSALSLANSLISSLSDSLALALFEDTPNRAELTSGQSLSCWCGHQVLMRKCQLCGGNPIETLIHFGDIK